jgi:exonuclease III
MSKKSELQQLAAKYSPEIFLIQETWLKPYITPPPISGYIIVRKDRVKRAGGGVAIYIKEEIEFEEMSFDFGFIESAAVKIFTEGTNITFASLYMPPSQTRKKEMKTFFFRWNQLDVAIVLLSVLGIVLEEMKSDLMPINPTIMRVMRVLRIARGNKY